MPLRAVLPAALAAVALLAAPAAASAAQLGAPVPPHFGRSVLLAPVAGTVAVTLPGTAQAVPLTGEASVPFGSTIDAARGRVRVTTAADRAGTPQSTELWGGAFAVHQGGGTTELHLAGPALACAKKAKGPRTRSLSGQDGGGLFRTHSRDSVATLRGATWRVQEACARTTTRVLQGTAQVLDRRTRRASLIRAGRYYVARVARRKRA